jgi:hypothetical protein
MEYSYSKIFACRQEDRISSLETINHVQAYDVPGEAFWHGHKWAMEILVSEVGGQKMGYDRTILDVIVNDTLLSAILDRLPKVVIIGALKRITAGISTAIKVGEK